MMGLSEATLRSYVSYGEIPPPNVPVRVLEGGWTPEVILAWLEERKAARFGPSARA
jgi:predicted DNA-binding transcriptional regulator AlpA